jgi:hypothetical protein
MRKKCFFVVWELIETLTGLSVGFLIVISKFELSVTINELFGVISKSFFKYY